MSKLGFSVTRTLVGSLRSRPIGGRHSLPLLDASLVQAKHQDSLHYYSSYHDRKDDDFSNPKLSDSFKVLGKLMVNKVKSLLSTNNPSSNADSSPRYPGYTSPQPLQGGLVTQMFFKLIEKVLTSTIKMAQKEMEAMMAQVQQCEAEATSQIRRSSHVYSRFGGDVTISPPLSQSSSSFSINGVSRKRLTLVFRVSGPRGNGQAIAVSTRGIGGDSVHVEMIMDSGEKFHVNPDRLDDSGPGGERIIDVDFREIKRK